MLRWPTRDIKGQAAIVAAVDLKQKWQWFVSSATTTNTNGTTKIYPMAIDVNAKGEIVIGGTIEATSDDVSFGTHKVWPGGSAKGFLATLTPGGAWTDAAIIGGTNQRIYISGIDHDAKDNLTITGGLSNEATFGAATIKSASWLVHFVASRSASGTWRWATSGQGFPTAVDPSKIDYKTNIAVLPSGDYFVVGGLVGKAFGGQTLAPVGTGSNAFIGYNPHIQGE